MSAFTGGDNNKTLENLTNIDDQDINPHMPQYIIKAPWYLNQTEPSLKHQKARTEGLRAPITVGTIKGIIEERPIYKYRKGACSNCGSMTHTAKECCERPRKVGAKYTGKDFKPDEYIYEIPLDFEGKRDRWKNYDPSSFKRLVQEHDKIEEALKRKMENEPKVEEEKIEELEDDYVEPKKNIKEIINEMQDPKDPKINLVVNNRIIDDYSKYLQNLDSNSAYYDAKSRSMRENPNPELEDTTFKGDNYTRLSGDTIKLLQLENFINEANEKHPEQMLNNIAMPSQAELFYRHYKEKKVQYKSENMRKLISQYGGEEHLFIPDEIKPLEDQYFAPEEEPIKVQKYMKKSLIKSIYPEDIFINGHKSVWGSFYHSHFGWGYKCCYSFDKNSSCKGIEGKKENLFKIDDYEQKKKEELNKLKEKNSKKEVEEKIEGGLFSDFFNRHEQAEKKQNIANNEEKLLNQKRLMTNYTFQRDLDKELIDDNKLKKSILKQKKVGDAQAEDEIVTAEDMEAYKMLKVHFDDPMRNLK